jgi:hypothetical protein
MLEGLLSECARVVRLGPDPLRNASVLLCLAVLLGGVILLGLRVRAAWKGIGTPPSLLACRMSAVLGALGGFVIYLRDLSRPGTRFGLVLGGASALPWVAVIVLEAARSRLGGHKGAGTRGRGRE